VGKRKATVCFLINRTTFVVIPGSLDTDFEAKRAMSEMDKKGTGKGAKGAQADNRNSVRHGLTAGKLPKGCQHIENTLNSFRRQVEDLVLAAKGSVSMGDAAAIQTALRWERHGALALRWLTKRGDELKPLDQLAFSREIAKASTERDKALASLGLNKSAVHNAWACIDVAPGESK